MALHKVFLVLHLTGAAVTGACVLLAIAALWQRRETWYRKLAIGVAVVSGWQLVTGSLLSLVSFPAIPLLHYCRNIGLYIAVIAVVQTLLYRRLRSVAGFPIRLTAASGAIGLTVTVLVGVALYA